MLVIYPPQIQSILIICNLVVSKKKVKIKNFGEKCLVIGDMNARIGTSVKDLPDRIGLTQYSYPVIPDPISTPNDNALAMLGICVEEHMLVVNNLKTPDIHFPSKKTFRKGRNWVSELDTCIVSDNLINFIQYFNVIYNESLPSDHAPIVITLHRPSVCLENIHTRASDLGKHGAECNRNLLPG